MKYKSLIVVLLLAAGPRASVRAQGPTPTPLSTDEALEAELARERGVAPTPTPSPTTTASGGTLRLIDLSLDGLFVGGFSSADDGDIGVLHAGGHDPKQIGFTVQNVEISLLGAVDPYLRGEAHVILQIDEQGETGVELEEAFLTTQTLPAGLQLKAGQFFTEAGRLNPIHPHAWHFADQPVINTRLFGPDGLRGPGARLSWLTPLSWFSELLISVQNARGETQFSFLSTQEAGEFSGHRFVERPVDGPEDLLYTLRSLNSFDLSEATTLNLGATGVFGPNATGAAARTTLLGADLYLKWRRLANYQGYPFIAWQTEALYRNYEVGRGEGSEPGQPAIETELEDWGLYTQLLWGYRRGWVAGARVDLADGDGAADDPLRDRRLRLSANLTHFPTEYSKLRVQYNLDRARHLDEQIQHSIWIQFEFLLGAHGAHKF
jgi:hypothetical protein